MLQRQPSRDRDIALALGAVPVAIGALALAGWSTGALALTRWVKPLPVMVPSTAASLLLLGVGCAFAARAGSRALTSAALGGALLSLALSGATLAAYAVGATVGPERLFLYDAVRQAGIVTVYAGRMSPQTAGALVCLALALTCQIVGARAIRRIVQPLSIVAAALALVAVAGHLYGVVVLFGLTRLVAVALPTAVGVIATALAILSLAPDEGIYALLARPGPTGRHARHLTLAAFVIPFGGAALFRWGELAGLYDARFGAAAYVASTALLLLGIVWAVVRSVLRWDAQREQFALERSAREVAEKVAHELHEREERLAVTLRSIGDAVIAADATRRVTLLNPVAEELTGWNAEDAVGRPLPEVFRIVNEDTRETAPCPADRVLRDGVVVELANHTALVRRDGSERPIADSAAPIRDSAGRVSGVVLVFRDQTAERQAKKALCESREEALARATQLEAVLDCIGDGVIVYDHEGRTVRSSPAADAMLRVPVDDRQAPVAERVMRQYEVRSEDGRLLGRDEMVAVRAAVRGETVPGAVYQVRAAGEEPRWLLLSGRPLRVGGQHAGAVLSMTDVTDRKHAEERLATVSRLYAVLSRVNEVIVRTRDERTLYADVCRIVADQGGFPLVWIGIAQGKSVTPVASFGAAADYVASIKVEVDGDLGRGPTGTCVREGRAAINDDFESNRSTQPWRAAALEHGLRASAAFPLRRGGKVIGALTLYTSRPGTFTAAHVQLLEALSADVSYALDAMDQERLRAEAERALRESELSLREVDERKNNFLAMLSHELRNPLAPIRNSLHVLERVPPGSAQSARAQEVLGRQVDHLTRLVDDLLDATRISRGKLELRKTVVDLRDLVQKACADHLSVFEQRGIELQVTIPGTALWVDADVTRISQALRNLLVNAVKFTPEGGHVAVTAARVRDRVEVSVDDDGVGVEPAALAHVFEPFVQAESGRGLEKGGLGLGLALVKGFAEAHGGTVRAASAGVNLGTRFTMCLPLTRAPQPRQETSQASVATSALDVLVIEDNVDGAETLAAVLELHGHRAHIANDGPSGLTKARELEPNVILCDIDLPGLSGYDIARTLKAEGRLAATRLIAISGYARADDRRLALDAGFSAHLAKPVSIDELTALLSASSGAPPR